MDVDCAVPAGVSVNTTRSIIDAFRSNGILQFAKSNHHHFNLVHLPYPNVTGIRNRKEQSLDDGPPLLDWISQNPPPAHSFFICNDTRFSGLLNDLRTNYNIIWYWKDLVKGEDPSSSGRPWYLIYKGICADPFTMSVSDQHKSPTGIEEDSSNAELLCQYTHHPVPQILVHHLRDILYCVPGGLTITELRNELEARKVSIDEVFFYGYQKFVHLLQALPYIVDVQSRPDGQFIVRHAIYAVYQSLLSSNANASEQSVDYDYEHRRVPSDVIRLLCRIVGVHPEGLSITEFKKELEKSNVVVDYEAFYGYGTLLRLLLALPQCAVLESVADGEIIVRPPPTKYSIMYTVLGMGSDVVDSGSIRVLPYKFDQENSYGGGLGSTSNDDGFHDDQRAELRAQDYPDASISDYALEEGA